MKTLRGYCRFVDLADRPDVPQVAAALDEAGVGDLLHREGLAVLDGLADLDPAGWPDAFVRICRALGEMLPQSATDPDSLVRQVAYRRAGLESRTTRYSDSRTGGSYHSDGVPIPGDLPDLLALLCVRPAESGGELVFIDSREILERATRLMPELPEVLSAPFHFDQRRPDDPGATVVRQIIEKTPMRLVYLRDYIESGHAINGVRPLTPPELAAMNVLDSVLDDETIHIEGRLTAGQIAISDNRRYLHGRHTFHEADDTPLGRLMLRGWIRQA